MNLTREELQPKTFNYRTLLLFNEYNEDHCMTNQFPGIGWKSPSLYPERAIRGSVKKASQVSEILPHPKTSVWHVTKSQLERLRKKDPMEYLNLLDPSNVIPTEKAIYQWLIRDQGEIGKGITVGESCVSSGFLRNRKPHIPPSEQRDFRSIYRKSFCEIPARNEIEGLESIDPQNYAFPGYGGSTTMRDVPSSFMSFGEHLLKSEPDFRRPYRRASSAKPKL
ncbi:hypothetical protein Avbf_11150 [Armadillidium vulgare]|nr:hypothetical protein Avbf_11150 [Armadillidium vulgare]